MIEGLDNEMLLAGLDEQVEADLMMDLLDEDSPELKETNFFSQSTFGKMESN